MTSLLSRLFLSGKLWLRALMAPAEDPRQTFAHAYERQRELLMKVQLALADITATKQRLERKTADIRAKLPQLEERARHSLWNGREDQARLALQRRQMALVELQALEKQVQDVEREEHRLSLIEQRLSTQIEAYFAHQEIIAASYSAAEARVQLQEALTGVSEEMSKLGRALERAEQQSEHMQARAAAIDRLVEEGILDTPALPAGEAVARQLARLDMDTAVEEQLASLKRQLE